MIVYKMEASYENCINGEPIKCFLWYRTEKLQGYSLNIPDVFISMPRDFDIYHLMNPYYHLSTTMKNGQFSPEAYMDSLVILVNKRMKLFN